MKSIRTPVIPRFLDFRFRGKGEPSSRRAFVKSSLKKKSLANRRMLIGYQSHPRPIQVRKRPSILESSPAAVLPTGAEQLRFELNGGSG
ncbi:MAG: hypothetical protein F4X56_02180 [Gammaproteobacteria bacterium]|nr:hypothetical protein [Gammaproteobacteria bacterium]